MVAMPVDEEYKEQSIATTLNLRFLMTVDSEAIMLQCQYENSKTQESVENKLGYSDRSDLFAIVREHDEILCSPFSETDASVR